MSSLLSSRFLLGCCNLLLLICGILLIASSILLLADSDRVLLSRLLVPGPLPMTPLLPHPFFYYVAIGLTLLGLLVCSASVLGFWAACSSGYCALSGYLALILAALVGECAVFAAVAAWPQCLGLTVDPPELARTLQRSYGSPGHEQFTTAFDLAQTQFKCCGVSTDLEYDTSLWRLQSFGHPKAAVPMSCCRLDNAFEPNSYLDPRPINNSLCQLPETEQQQGFRHAKGCISYLEKWYHEQYILFIAGGLVVILVEFAAVLSTILACTRKQGKSLPKSRSRSSDCNLDYVKDKTSTSENIYTGRIPLSYSNEAYTLSNSFRQNYRLKANN